MANVEDALEFDVEEGFFFFLKKKNVWFLLQLTLSFVFCLHCYLLAFDFLFYVFLKLDIVFIYRSTKTRVHVWAQLHISPFLFTIFITWFYLLLLP
jgi:hypothetical protein